MFRPAETEAALAKPVQAEIARLRPLSRGPRSAAAWKRHRQRMAEINANLAIEDMPLTADELAFFDLAFGLNLPEDKERALRKFWIAEGLKANATIAELCAEPMESSRDPSNRRRGGSYPSAARATRP